MVDCGACEGTGKHVVWGSTYESNTGVVFPCRECGGSGKKVKSAAELCKHPRVPIPVFDAKAAIGLDVSEIRRRWPRGNNICPDCGGRLILYASAEHYIMGDW